MVTVKVIGAMIVLAGSFAIGKYYADKLSQRVNLLMSIEEALLVFEGEIKYKLSDINDAFSASANPDISGIFKDSALNTYKYGAASAFRDAVMRSGIEKDEKNALLAFSSGLQSPDADGQVNNSKLCRERISRIIKKAKEKRDMCEKLYTVSGFFAGIATIIVLI